MNISDYINSQLDYECDLATNGNAFSYYLKDNLSTIYASLPCSEQEKIKKEINCRIDNEQNAAVLLFLMSAKLKLNMCEEILASFLSFVLNTADERSAENNYFVFRQLNTFLFQYPSFESDSTFAQMTELLRVCVQQYRKAIGADRLTKIPTEERNHNLVFLITEQFLDSTHAPTKATLSRAKMLMETMGKTVIIVNTSETLSTSGMIPFWGALFGTYIKKNEEITCVQWQNCKIPYVQFPQNMPNLENTKQILELIREYKPGLIIETGYAGMVASLINDLIPVLTIGMVPSSLYYSLTDYFVMSRQPGEEEKRRMLRANISEEKVLVGTFGFEYEGMSFPKNKQNLDIPEETFVLGMVGSRLDADLTDEFLYALEKMDLNKMLILFIGKYDGYEQLNINFPNIHSHSMFLGMVNRSRDYMPAVDLYINPPRKGGGTSVFEALAEGVPVITLAFGDGAINSGDDFIIGGINEIEHTVIKYKSESGYAASQSQKARTRAQMLMNAEYHFVKIVAEYMERMYK